MLNALHAHYTFSIANKDSSPPPQELELLVHRTHFLECALAFHCFCENAAEALKSGDTSRQDTREAAAEIQKYTACSLWSHEQNHDSRRRISNFSLSLTC